MQADDLIAQALDDPSKEGKLFKHLLASTVFVHAPTAKKSTRLSIVQFRTPQGLMAIPVFTDETKAEFAGRGSVRIVAISGRALLLATLGATVVINPNDTWCILYPEEIRALLAGQNLSTTPEQVRMAANMKLRRVQSPEANFVSLIGTTLSCTEHAIDAWLTESAEDDSGPAGGYVVVVAADAPHHERIARALTLALAEYAQELGKTVDVTFIAPGKTHDKWLIDHRESLIYRREWLSSLKSDIHGNA